MKTPHEVLSRIIAENEVRLSDEVMEQEAGTIVYYDRFLGEWVAL